MSLAPLHLVSAHPWQRATFTTYALSLSFFEAVILDALIRGGGKQAVILADVQGLRASLSEQGAQRVGKDYEVEPVAVSSGRSAFHPKISVFSGKGECHLLVGSGNLNFNGWGGNFEILEHLHPSFAADAFADAADFFELLSVTERVRHGAEAHCNATAAELRLAIEGQPRNGDIRIFHNLDRSISEQLVEIARDMGGATQLLVAAPFWDKGAAIDRLCEALGLDRVFIHAHAYGTVEGTAGANWPESCPKTVYPVRLGVMEDPRRLHAKAFEIMCRKARILVSGSANATNAALGAGGNVEACVVRVQRARTDGWTFVACEPPEPQAALEDETDKDEKQRGVLRAVLEAEKLRGDILTPPMRGAVSVFYVFTAGPELLGQTTVSADGGFEIGAPALEQKSWAGGRLVIRVVDEQGRTAEGFVSVASFAEIADKTGAAMRNLLAALAGGETPADIAAIMNWFHANPGLLAESMPPAIGGGGKDPNAPEKPAAVIAVAELSGVGAAAAQAAGGHKGSGGSMNRLMAHLLAALRQRRGPVVGPNGVDKEDDDEGDGDGNNNIENGKNKDKDKDANNAAVDEAFANFEKLFDLLLKPGGDARQALNAFDLTQYICDRLEPEGAQAVKWLRQLFGVLLERGVPPERRGDVAAAILTLLGASVPHTEARWARDCLIRLGFDPSGDAPSNESAAGFQSVLPQVRAFTELWPEVQAIRTWPEQVRSYLEALDGKTPSGEFKELENAAKEEWPMMKAALKSKNRDKRVVVRSQFPDSCPRCFILLPSGERDKLHRIGIATTKSCNCGKVVIWTGR